MKLSLLIHPFQLSGLLILTCLHDPRYSILRELLKTTKADYAFVTHMIHHLDDNGTMAVVVPHGVLFRGAAEGLIREF